MTVPSLNSFKLPFLLYLQVRSGIPWFAGREGRKKTRKINPWDHDENLLARPALENWELDIFIYTTYLDFSQLLRELSGNLGG